MPRKTISSPVTCQSKMNWEEEKFLKWRQLLLHSNRAPNQVNVNLTLACQKCLSVSHTHMTVRVPTLKFFPPEKKGSLNFFDSYCFFALISFYINFFFSFKFRYTHIYETFLSSAESKATNQLNFSLLRILKFFFSHPKKIFNFFKVR